MIRAIDVYTYMNTSLIIGKAAFAYLGHCNFITSIKAILDVHVYLLIELLHLSPTQSEKPFFRNKEAA